MREFLSIVMLSFFLGAIAFLNQQCSKIEEAVPEKYITIELPAHEKIVSVEWSDKGLWMLTCNTVTGAHRYSRLEEVKYNFSGEISIVNKKE